ncbi:MAG TPA: hypothetical protein VFK13_00155 [Gemmatimonadaceae bacterium]|nr:hypothetical protein [Gemmatimonadaceae bacterium]
MSETLEGIVNLELEKLGFELVELRRRGSRARPVVELRIDRHDGHPITVDDCARASRALEERLDAEGTVGDRYVLEVSSPGVERPLRTVHDWRRFVGQHAQVTNAELGGRVEVEILGVEGDDSDAVVTVRAPAGDEHRLSLATLADGDARLAFHW